MHTHKERPTANAEITGQNYEDMVAFRIKQMKFRYFPKSHHSCKIAIAEHLQDLGFGPVQVADGYLPDLHMYVEIKSGDGNETDSIDKKYLGDLVMLRHGHYGLHQKQTLTDETPHVLYIFAGQKEHSAYTNLWLLEVESAKQRGEYWAQYVHGIRLSQLTRDAISACVSAPRVLV